MSNLSFFILGIFAGWILEWIFYTLFVKKKQKPEKPAVTAAAVASVQQADAVKETKEAKVTGAVEKAAEASSAVAAETQEPAEKKVEAVEEAATEAETATEAEAAAEAEAEDPEAEKPADEAADQVDDLSVLKGVGPKLAESLQEAGIKSFAQLSGLKGDDIIAHLEEVGAKVVNKPALGSLPAQAELAAKGDWDALETLQKSL